MIYSGVNNALIGYTGFVGMNILQQKPFMFLYNSKNIEEIKGKEFDLIVCSVHAYFVAKVFFLAGVRLSWCGEVPEKYV